MDNKLKPCPFCGGEATFAVLIPPSEYFIECTKCLSRSRSVHAADPKEDFHRSILEEAWNNRPLDPDGCNKHVAQWVAAGKARCIFHLVNDTFVAADEVEKKYMHEKTLPLLADALSNWPEGSKKLVEDSGRKSPFN